jgi:hypothetical protein
MLGKFLGFDRMKTKYFFLFFEKGNWFKSFWDFFLKMFWIFFWNISKKTGYFNTEFVFYNVNIQLNIMKNW